MPILHFWLAALLTLSAHAAPFELNCVSYSREMDLRVSAGDEGVTLEVLRSSARGSFALSAPQLISLRPLGRELSPEWIGFEGVSNRQQNVTVKFRRADLTRSREFTGSLLVSADWTDATEVSHQIDCRR